MAATSTSPCYLYSQGTLVTWFSQNAQIHTQFQLNNPNAWLFRFFLIGRSDVSTKHSFGLYPKRPIAVNETLYAPYVPWMNKGQTQYGSSRGDIGMHLNSSFISGESVIIWRKLTLRWCYFTSPLNQNLYNQVFAFSISPWHCQM